MSSQPSSPLPGGNRPSTLSSMRHSASPMLMKRLESENRSLHANQQQCMVDTTVLCLEITKHHRQPLPMKRSSFNRSQLSSSFFRKVIRLLVSRLPSRVHLHPQVIEDHFPAFVLRISIRRLWLYNLALFTIASSPATTAQSHPKGKYVHPENQVWAEGVLGQVRKASADRRAKLLSAAAGF